MRRQRKNGQNLKRCNRPQKLSPRLGKNELIVKVDDKPWKPWNSTVTVNEIRAQIALSTIPSRWLLHLMLKNHNFSDEVTGWLDRYLNYTPSAKDQLIRKKIFTSLAEIDAQVQNTTNPDWISPREILHHGCCTDKVAGQLYKRFNPLLTPAGVKYGPSVYVFEAKDNE